jgi:hypothetical protein
MYDFPITNAARGSSRKSKVEYDNLVKLGVFSALDPSKYSFDMLLRVRMQVFRIASNFPLKDLSPLNSEELQRPEKVWIRAFQKKYFPTKLDYLQSKKKSWRPALVS